MARALPAASLAAVLSLSLAASAPALGAQAGFGSLVKAGDFDSFPGPLQPLPSVALCFADANLNGRRDPGEGLSLAAACGGAAGSRPHVRLSGPGAGAWVLPGDADAALPRLPSAAQLRMADRDGDGRWTPGDALYLLVGQDASSVGAGDVRLTPAGNRSAGTEVRAGDADAGAAVGLPSAGPFGNLSSARTWDLAPDRQWGRGDGLYLDLDGSGEVSVRDVRLAALPGLAMGPVMAGDADATPRLGPFGAEVSLCFLDRDGDGAYLPGEPVYLQRGSCPPARAGGAPAPLRAGDLRISGPAAGTKVEAGHGDLGAPTLQLPGFGNIRYSDLDRDARWSDGDTLYLHVAVGRSTVNEGDVRLTAFGGLPAGTVVGPGDSDLKFLTSFGAAAPANFHASPVRTWKLWDFDGDGAPDGADAVYIDLDDNGGVSVLDVRLVPVGGREFGSLVRPGDPEARPSLLPLAGASLCASLPANATEPRVYFQTRFCGPVAEGDLRLSGPMAGTKVTPLDPEAEAPTSPVPGFNNLRLYDADADGAWGSGDTLYLHLAAGRAEVRAQDLRLTAYGSEPPGSFVEAGSPDLGLATLPMPAAAALGVGWRAWDLDGDQRLDGDDLLYIDVDGSRDVSPLDVRMASYNRSAGGALLVSQIAELQRAVAALERVVARQAEVAETLREELAARNSTIAALEANLTQARAALAAARAPPPPRESPGAEPALLAAGAALVALAWRRR